MIKGTIVALVTPFNQDMSVNYQALGELIDFHIKNETDGILLLGTTGESESLSDEEKYEIVKYSFSRCENKIPIMVAITSNVTDKVISYAKMFESFDIDSFLVITPYYNKTNEDGMIKHFMKIADNVSKDIVIYNVPKRTGMCISKEALEKLKCHKRIKGIKEASGDIEFFTKVAQLASDDFYVYSGDDLSILPALSLGASGIISVASNMYPYVFKEIIKYFRTDVDKSIQIFNKYYDLFYNCFLEVSPIPIKFLMDSSDMHVGPCRLPYGELSTANKIRLLSSAIEIEE